MAEQDCTGAVVAFADAQALGDLRAEALAISAKIGGNPYSDYILKHGKRPDRAEAAAIGRLIGQQVRASDGTLQPRRTKAERQAAKEAREGKKQRYRKWDHIARLRSAILQLAQNEDDPGPMINEIATSERAEIGANLRKSIDWLTRFMNEWRRHGEQEESNVSKNSHSVARSLFKFEEGRRQPDNDP